MDLNKIHKIFRIYGEKLMHEYFLNTSPNTKKYKWLNEKLMFILNKKVEGFSI